MDKGDYYQRHNIHRHLIDGKMVRVEELPPGTRTRG
jgi:hypothetical protein